MKEESYILPQKAGLRQLKISDINAGAPDLKNIFESKAVAIAKWMINWIDAGLKDGIIEPNNLLPSKAEFAYFLRVSVGTIQNALRYIEDLGYVESKQCIGTMIRDKNKESVNIRKLTSKREIAIAEIKQYILEHKFKSGQNLPSSRTIATIIGCSANTTRLALEFCALKVLLNISLKIQRNQAGCLKILIL